MGVVYRGERVSLKRPVAIKFLHEGYAATDDGRRRFEVEARAMSRLDHPNCVPVTDFGVDEGSPYLVMDFVNGVTLRQLLSTEWRLAPDRAVAIVRQVLSGLSHAHAQGIIHRDIKPENILVTPIEGHGEHVRIVDFGLAKLRDEGSITTGVAVGTPGYMSPEQTVGQKADERADVYACGIILYELLAGAKPFQGESPFDVMRMHRETPPPPLEATASGVQISQRLQGVVMKALAKSREDRFQSASEFRNALEAVDEAQGKRSGGGATTIAVVAVLAVGAAAALVAWQPWASGDDTRAPDVAADRAPPPSEPATRPAEGKTPATAPAAHPADAAPAVAPATGDGAAPAQVPPAGKEPDEVARLRALATESGDVRGAIAGLEQLRNAQPSLTAAHYALANLYAETQAWAQSVQSYAATLRLDDSYRNDPRVISDVVEALGSNDARELAEKLIDVQLGANAIPRLEEASRSTNRDLRSRASIVLSRLKQRQ